MTTYIESTMECDNLYIDHNSEAKKRVRIFGTLSGASKSKVKETAVTDDQLKILEGNKSFVNHKAKGFLSVKTK